MVSKALVAMTTSLLIVAGAFGSAHAQSKPAGGPTTSPPGAAVYFVDIKDGQTVPTKFTVHFGLKGMGVAPAGSDKENSGHHHLLIDAELPPMDSPIPSDFNHLHFGAGQTEAEVTLTPGDHTLQLLLGDRTMCRRHRRCSLIVSMFMSSIRLQPRRPRPRRIRDVTRRPPERRSILSIPWTGRTSRQRLLSVSGWSAWASLPPASKKRIRGTTIC